MKSDCVRKGTEGAPRRALFHALGMTEEELNRPLVGIVNSYKDVYKRQPPEAAGWDRRLPTYPTAVPEPISATGSF